jgi:ADP-dependent NAD(P)H-hydrate dehydratase / NAD(P)H-hydrate epimerase
MNDIMANLPIKLYSAVQIKELERIAIEERGISGYELMTRAGQAVYEKMLEHCPDAKTITIFCGAGNNAGDGFIVARSALLGGFEVNVYCVTDPENQHGAALQAYQTYSNTKGAMIMPFAQGQPIVADVIVDAMLGTGLVRAVSGLYADAIAAINKTKSYTIAVDIPTGLHADTGNVLACAVKADCTATFIALKQGLFTGQAADYIGGIYYSTLDVPEDIFDQVKTGVARVTRISLPKRNRTAHKGAYGHVLVVGGDVGYSGAAKLTGEAAARVGAGLVSLATRKEHAGFINLNRPELMCHGIENTEQLALLIDKASVIVIGPGLGQSVWAKGLFDAVIETKKPLVVDADGLNLLARFPHVNPNWVLTPHPGEAARLLNFTTQEIQADRFAAVRAIQAKYGGIAVLKGSGSLIANRETVAVATTGNPGMATGGMGDVLAGLVAGLVAQGFSMEISAQQGVYLHGMAADLAAKEAGERGLLASDLMPYLRQLVN